jgi:hypothetical protein
MYPLDTFANMNPLEALIFTDGIHRRNCQRAVLRFSFARNIAKRRFHIHANCNNACDCSLKAPVFLTIFALACLVRYPRPCGT